MAEHSDRAFIRHFVMVFGSLFVIAAIGLILANVFGDGVEDHPQAQKALMAERLKPVAVVVTNPKALMAAAQATSASKPKLTGEQVVAQVCSACHATGMLGSPKIGDASVWGQRFKTQGGLDGLVKHAIHGLNQMPPRGGNPALTDEEIHDAVKYMLSKAGISG